MNQRSRDARQRLKEATREEFERLIYEAMLNPSQEKILRLHIAQDVSGQSLFYRKSNFSRPIITISLACIHEFKIRSPIDYIMRKAYFQYLIQPNHLLILCQNIKDE